MNTTIALLAGLAAGLLLGRATKQCAAPTAQHASKSDVIVGLIGLGNRAFETWG